MCGGSSVQKGALNRLILNGDCFEGCVPKDAGSCLGNTRISPFTSQVSQSFFKLLIDRVDLNELVIVPGNHDWAIWRDLVHSVGFVTGLRPLNADFLAASSVIDGLVGPSNKAKIAKTVISYPAYFLGSQWPYCAFHHGHFLDDLVIGQGSAEEYHALAVIGTKDRPAVNLDDNETLSSLSKSTDSFLNGLWWPNSKARALAWAMFRRDSANLHCNGMPGSEGLASNTTKNLEWFINVLMADSLAPFPNKTNSSSLGYLFVGHDHVGGEGTVEGPDGFVFKVINTGGWTDDGGKGIVPHGHLVMWEKGATEPIVETVKVR
jgi:hypothetical protein